LVSNLLDMARLNAGTVVLRKEWQPIEEVMGASIKLLKDSLIDHPIQVSLAPDLPLLAFDAVLMERVFCNLIENSAKYSPAGTKITIKVQQNPSHVIVEIVDQGPGFSEPDSDQLFKMFVRGQSLATQAGSGLGLAICKAIVEAHQGEIGIRHLNCGGCVFFSLPKGQPPLIEEERE
jgi:two-component system sensor histidine kinase KdpD